MEIVRTSSLSLRREREGPSQATPMTVKRCVQIYTHPHIVPRCTPPDGLPPPTRSSPPSLAASVGWAGISINQLILIKYLHEYFHPPAAGPAAVLFHTMSDLWEPPTFPRCSLNTIDFTTHRTSPRASAVQETCRS